MNETTTPKDDISSSLELRARLDCLQLRWRCDPALVPCESTDQFPVSNKMVGQSRAEEALRFGIECRAFGQNVYVRGLRGTGRITLVRQLLAEIQPRTDAKRDRCYVHNFVQPDRPRLITLAAGKAPEFKQRIAELGEFILRELVKALDTEPHLSQRQAAQEALQRRIQDVTEPLERALTDNQMAMVTVQQGPLTTTAIFPTHQGEALPPDQLKALIDKGEASPEQWSKFESLWPQFQKELDRVARQVHEIVREGRQQLEQLKQNSARQLLATVTSSILHDFPGSGVSEFIDQIVRDAAEKRLAEDGESPDRLAHYGVNIISTHDVHDDRAPIIEEIVPNIINLLGTVDTTWTANEGGKADFRGVRGGAILRADAGFLILDVEDLLAEPGSYRALMRTLRTRRLEIVPPEVGWLRPFAVIQPEPIEVQLRVVLIGDIGTYYHLDQLDPDFRELFKVLADLDDQIERDTQGIEHYTSVIASLAREESLLPFHRTGVASLVEHGARIVSRGGKLTAKFGRVADIAREAAFLAQQGQSPLVHGDHVIEAVARTKIRASLPSRRFSEMVESSAIVIETSGRRVGQINGLGVMAAGPLTYGFPARITATIGPGTTGVISIEGQSQMSGMIHTKGFHILGGLLRQLLQTDHPLSFSASLAFEQSYVGIDGDSASGAEIICLLSALTATPIRQDLAMTGAIDQTGRFQAIGGVNEKIEGFFDVCQYFGLTGTQGVVIPSSNSAELMLRHDVVEACRRGEFHIYAVDRVTEAIEMMTGVAAGERSSDGHLPPHSLLGQAVARAREYWEKTLAAPRRIARVATPPTP
ncbi:MAG TPA: AAA family ATPase [Pirellulaceae bacterium]|nr:AAA family ATPase [Pirellulaceae bacterium]